MWGVAGCRLGMGAMAVRVRVVAGVLLCGGLRWGRRVA